jgi:putative nucleotidyltransferase with HDIG domain
MAERSKNKSRKRSSVVKNFLAIGELEKGLIGGLSAWNVFLGLCLAAGVTALLVRYEFTSIPNYQVGDIAERTIEAPQDFTVIAESETEAKKQEALRGTPAIFVFDYRVNQRVFQEIRIAFEDSRQELAEELSKKGFDNLSQFSKASLEALKARLEGMNPKLSYRNILDILLKYGFSEEIEDQCIQLLTRATKSPGVVLNREDLIRFQERGILLKDAITGEEERLNDWLAIRDLDQAKDVLRQQEYELTAVTEREKKEIIDFLESWIIPNTRFDEDATVQAEKQAIQEVDPVLIQIKRGRTIVRAGDEITAQNLDQLKALRDLKNLGLWQARTAGIFFITVFFLFVLWSYIYVVDREIQKSRSDFLLVILITLLSLVITRVIVFLSEIVSGSLRVVELQDPSHFYLLAPLSMGAILIVLLLSSKLAVLFSVTHSVLIMLLTDDLAFGIYNLAGCLAAVYLLRQYRERTVLIRAGFFIGGVGIIFALCLQFYVFDSSFQLSPFLVRSFAAMLSGITSAMLAALFLPILESLFGLTTDIRLLELSNLNNPILRRMALEAPGTYHHSLTVGTLAEAGAEAINANALLIRVGAYYHDIGKLKHPEYYVENQIFTINKHENLSPTMSSLILASHVKDGLAIAKELGLGPKVSQMIPQHHGTRIMTFFYQKAKEAAAEKGGEVNENDFRYPGPKPQFKEAAILMLADQVEAAARTLQAPNPSQISSMIQRIFQATIQDGQLIECDITLKELYEVAQAFERVITGMHHHRIEYPGFNFNKQVEKSESQPIQ